MKEFYVIENGQQQGPFDVNTIVNFRNDDYYNNPLFISVDAYCTHEYSAVGFYDKCRFWPSEFMNQQLDTLRMYRILG